jgi:hypothetical protein
MKKQTAVDWLEKFLKERYPLMDSEAIFQHAKEIEKEQIIEFANSFYHDCGMQYGGLEKSAQQYYNETYK